MPRRIISRLFGRQPGGAPLHLRSYLRRLIWWCMLPLVVLAVALGVLRVRADMAERDRSATRLAQAVAAAVDQELLARINALNMLARAPQIDQPATQPEFHAQALAFRDTFGSEVLLADTQGRLLLHTGVDDGRPLPPLPRPSGRSALATALNTGLPAVGDLFAGPTAGAALVAIAVPVLRQGQALAVLVTVLDAARFAPVLQRTALPADWSAVLLDGQQQPIARSGGPRAAGAAADSGAQQVLVATEQALWTVQLDVPRSAREAPILAGAVALLAALALATCIGAVGGALASRRLAQSVAALALPADDGDAAEPIEEIAAVRSLMQAQSAQREAALVALGDSQRTFQALFNGMPDAMVFTDPCRRILLVNPAFSRVYGYRADEVIGRTTTLLYADPLDYDRVGREHYHANEHAATSPFEMRHRRHDGSVFWAETCGMRIQDAQGGVIGMLGVHRDITARRRDDEVLRRSRTQLLAFIQQAPHDIAMLDRGMNYLAVSRRWQLKHGRGTLNLVGMNHYTVNHDVPAAWRAVHEQALQGHTVANEHDHWVQADGTELWLNWVVVPWHDDQGAVGGIIISTEDISERVRAGRQLQEMHERFASVFQSSPLAILVGTLPAGTLVDANPAAEQLLGYSRDELLGQNTQELALWVDPELRDQVRAQVIAGGQVRSLELQFRCKSGRIIDLAFSALQVQIGGTPHFLSLASDITAQKQAQRELQGQQARLEGLVQERTAALAAANASLEERARAITALYDDAPCGYLSLQPDGTVTEANHTALALLGYTRSEFVGAKLSRYMSPASQALHAQRARAALAGGQGRALEYEFVRGDGRLLQVLIDADFERDANGRMLGARATMVDNSERHERERQIADMQLELARRADLAETANRAKSAFLANMSHEIRTPMNAIIGLTRLLQRDAQEPLQRERLAKVAAAGQHLLQVINDVLDLSKIEASKMDLHAVDFALAPLLERAHAMVADTARSKGLALVFDTAQLPARLHGDDTRLLQALINLLANAVKFTAQGWVRLRGEVLAQDGERIKLRFEVQDSGEGIAPEHQHELFGAFEQADSSLTRRHGGTGLGLALTRNLAELMGGEVGMRSTLGQGSVFWFTAWMTRLDPPPALPPPAPAQAGPVAESNEARLRRLHSGTQVLLAEDNPVNQEVASELLRCTGLLVDTVDDGAQAVAQVQARPYALVLMDMQMPVLDGLGAARAIRASAGAQPRIIAMTANAFSEDRQACLDAGMDDHVAKPVDPEQLYATLLRWLGAPRAPGP